MPSVRALFTDIRTWILLLALVRLVGITDPPLEAAHNWRQTTVLMVARNYYEQGPDLLHPRIDFAGERTGITGMEFPLLNYLVYAVAAVFGWAGWYGRAIVLLSSMLGAWAFHRLVRRYVGDRIAFIATLLLLSSLWFQYGRKTMPDVFALSLVMAGLWWTSQVLHGERPGLNGWLAGVSIALGVLSKSPAALLLVALLPMCWMARAARTRVMLAVAIAGLALIPSVWWYGCWVPHLVRAYGFWHFFMGKGMAEGVAELVARWPEVAEKFYFDALRFSGCAAFIGGLVVAARRRANGLLLTLAAFACAQTIIMLKAGGTFAGHSYYILPFVPIMAVVAAYGLTALPGRWPIILTALIAMEGLLNAQHDLHLRPDQRELLSLEPFLDGATHRDERIVINAGDVPTAMYLAHRKGWLAHNADLQRPVFVDSLAALGCRYVVVLKDKGEGDVAIGRPVVAEDAHFRLLRATR
ncbi:MAG: glycosyltransferase family 39 protein [Flavobacteriales bacterium]